MRGVTIWLLARVMGHAALAAGSTTESTGLLLPAWALMMTASLVLVDFHRRHELMLLQNLGVSSLQAVLMATVPAVVLETLLVMLSS